jgi:sulfite dehydrogenase (quinone) subunit SoeC
MHPAYSVIFFTTASGAGYGLIVWLTVFGVLGLVPTTQGIGLLAIVSALVLISTGLLSSTFHLGHPERAWRAVTQWRSSWLSREGVLALVTYIPIGILGIGWVVFETANGLFAVAAILAAFFSLATVWCTGMIYASLKTIRAWHHPLVAPAYVILGLATGGILFGFLLRIVGESSSLVDWLSIILLVISLFTKLAYWRAVDRGERKYNAGAATGLGQFGKVRTLDSPHTQPNFVMREMGYWVARKHALKLRQLSVLSAFVVPIIALAASNALGSVAGLIASFTAALSVAIGISTERWLFFAEAEHVAMLYYGLDEA